MSNAPPPPNHDRIHTLSTGEVVTLFCPCDRCVGQSNPRAAAPALLLGAHPSTIRELSPSIIEFSDLGEFIDYPVKTYSAGMMVRLAFAISTAIGGEILLLDEILGAGDITFMQKARARIENLISDAHILLLATHDLASIRVMCNRVLVMDHGRLVFDGPVEEGIALYTAT